MRENRAAFDAPPDRPADAARRRAARRVGRAVRPPPRLAVPARARRRARARPPRRRPRRSPAPRAPTGVPMIFSNQASRPMEECAAAIGDSPRWFQLYWSTSDELVESLVARAEACGCEAIVRHARHDDRSAGARATSSLAFLPFLRGQGHRAVHERPGVPPPDGATARATATRPTPQPTPQALRTLVAAHARVSRPVPEEPASGRGRAAVQRFLEIYSRAVADLGRPAVPARAHEAADPAQGHPAPRRRAPRARRRRRRHRRLQPRRPPGRRRDRDARRAARRRRGGRRPRAGAARQRRARRRRRLQGARARRHARC